MKKCLPISINKQDILLTKLQNYREDDFTNEILIPLFKELGYSDVHFNGGVYEEGKDLIAMKVDEFGDVEIAVAQVKKFKTTRSTANRQQLDAIIYQLRQCNDRPINYKDGNTYKPKDIFFITPYVLETKLLKEQFNKLGSGDKKIRVIDGSKLYWLLLNKCPEIIEKIIGIDGRFSNINESRELTNLELLSALNINIDFDFSDYYSDLNFFVGSVDSNLLHDCIFEFNSKSIEIAEKDEWLVVKKIIIDINNIVNFNLLSSTVKEIEKKYDDIYKQFSSDDNLYNINELEKIINKFLYYTDIAIGSISKIKGEINIILNNRALLKKYDEDNIYAIDKTCIQAASTIKDSNLTNDLKINFQGLAKQLKDVSLLDTRFEEKINNIQDSLSRMESLSNEYVDLKRRIIVKPKYSISFNKKNNDAWFNNEICWYKDSVLLINHSRLTNIDIREFIARIQRLLGAIDKLINYNNEISSRVSLIRLNKYNLDKDRLDISAHSIFDSGSNIALFGEAGAGKTTTLQVYAQKYELNKTEHEYILYIPLNRLSNKYINLQDSSHLEVKNEFDKLLVAYLIYKNFPYTNQKIDELKSFLFSKKKIIFILDGLDEAVKSIPWILKAISSAHEQIKHLQIIASTRDCVNYLRDIDFIGITLLPFNEDQLKRFIKGWMRDKVLAGKLIHEIKNESLFEVAKNPLLATIICSLSEHGIEIPRNEPEVYRKKISLLCGAYDHFKNIKRVRTQESVLEEACRKIAFYLHQKGCREANINEISKVHYNTLEGRMDEQYAKLAIEELINPCNILKKDPFSNLYGFGHLRYQEYLASEELKNRSIDIIPLLSKDWWRGVLYLYSFSNKLDYLIEESYKHAGQIIKYEKTFRMMIQARPPNERAGLTEIINFYIKQDKFERDALLSPLEYDESLITNHDQFIELDFSNDLSNPY